MKVTESDVVEAQAKQRQASKRATLAKLKNKKRNEREVPLYIDGEEMTILLRAISNAEYDAMLDEHPPTSKQREEGASYNGETFPPALFSAVCIDPKISYEEALDIWTSDNFSRGEVAALWEAALNVVLVGFNVPFTKSD